MDRDYSGHHYEPKQFSRHKAKKNHSQFKKGKDFSSHFSESEKTHYKSHQQQSGDAPSEFMSYLEDSLSDIEKMEQELEGQITGIFNPEELENLEQHNKTSHQKKSSAGNYADPYTKDGTTIDDDAYDEVSESIAEIMSQEQRSSHHDAHSYLDQKGKQAEYSHKSPHNLHHDSQSQSSKTQSTPHSEQTLVDLHFYDDDLDHQERFSILEHSESSAPEYQATKESTQQYTGHTFQKSATSHSNNQPPHTRKSTFQKSSGNSKSKAFRKKKSSRFRSKSESTNTQYSKHSYEERHENLEEKLRLSNTGLIATEADYVFSHHNEEEPYYFLPYNYMGLIPAELQGLNSETAWGVATITGCSAIILTIWLLLYWITPDNKKVVLDQKKSFEETDVVTAILNIPTSEIPPAEKIPVQNIPTQKIPTQKIPVKTWEPVDLQPVNTGFPQIGIRRERYVYNAPRDYPSDQYTWQEQSTYRTAPIWDHFANNGWKIAHVKFLTKQDASFPATMVTSLADRWNKGSIPRAKPNTQLASNENINSKIPSICTISPEIIISPENNLTESGVGNADDHHAVVSVSNRSKEYGFEVKVTAYPSELCVVKDASAGLMNVSPKEIAWSPTYVTPLDKTHHEVFQTPRIMEGIASTSYEIEMKTEVSAVTKVESLGVALDLDQVKKTPVGDYVYLTFSVQNRGSLPIEHALLKVKLPDLVGHVRGTNLEHELENLNAGETRSVSLTVLAEKQGLSQVQANLIQDGKEMATDTENLEVTKPPVPAKTPVVKPVKKPELPEQVDTPKEKPLPETTRKTVPEIPIIPMDSPCGCGGSTSYYYNYSQPPIYQHEYYQSGPYYDY